MITINHRKILLQVLNSWTYRLKNEKEVYSSEFSQMFNFNTSAKTIIHYYFLV